MTGHSAHDDAGTFKQLFEYWETRDPIRRLERTLVQQNHLTEAGITDMQNGIVAEIDRPLMPKGSVSRTGSCLRDVYLEE
jgi:TPP-dependent pyruvate/acetoin dehydrogenase alpha subunit